MMQVLVLASRECGNQGCHDRTSMESVMTQTTLTTEASAAESDRDTALPNPHFTTSFTVDQTPEAAFKAITNVRGWWSENIEGATDELGEFVFHNEPIHVSRIEVTDLVPGKRVAWRVLENSMSFVDDKREWIGNEMVFGIARNGDKTEVVFTQIGLVPDYECFDICSNAWGGYIRASLRSLIATGKGAPDPSKA
jgi:hypothetical protein